MLFVFLTACQPQIDDHHHDENRHHRHPLDGLEIGSGNNINHQKDHHGQHEPSGKPGQNLIDFVKKGFHKTGFSMQVAPTFLEKR